MGFEPTTSSLGIRGSGTLSADVAGSYDPGDPGLVSCLVSIREDTELRELVIAWNAMPAAARADIMALIRVSTAGRAE